MKEDTFFKGLNPFENEAYIWKEILKCVFPLEHLHYQTLQNYLPAQFDAIRRFLQEIEALIKRGKFDGLSKQDIKNASKDCLSDISLVEFMLGFINTEIMTIELNIWTIITSNMHTPEERAVPQKLIKLLADKVIGIKKEVVSKLTELSAASENMRDFIYDAVDIPALEKEIGLGPESVFRPYK